MSKFQFDERKLKPGQRQAAALLVEYEFAPKKERKTKGQIAEIIGISRKQLHQWDTADSNFIAYKNHLASQIVDSQLALVYSKLMDGIKNGSMKGIELYLKRMGELKDTADININDNCTEQSFEDRKAALLERLGAAPAEDNTTDGEGNK